MAAIQSDSAGERASEHRHRGRRKGARPVEDRLPNLRLPAFKLEAHRQSLAVAASAHARDNQAFIDAVSGLGFDVGIDCRRSR